jgi:hypothetical protein
MLAEARPRRPRRALPEAAPKAILGLLGFSLAGTQVKSIIKGSTMRHALAIWSIFIHGDIRGQGDVGNGPSEGRPPREDA